MSGVTIRLDEATPLFERVRSAATAKGLALVAARAVGGLVKEHLYGLDNQRHRFGSHFYRQAGDSVTTGYAPQGAFVAITQTGFRQRLNGGTITPKNGVYLTIPAAPEAYGHRAREFPDLDFAYVHDPDTDSLRPALVRRAQTKIRHRRVKGEGGATTFKASAIATLMPEVMYWLVRSVEQQPDPTVLPYAEQMTARGVAAINTRLQRLSNRAAQDIGGDN
ncbi:MAG: hypothetical protein KGL39_48415 [Patescibacteria group bacterium]|nr:hypothetical protein [Patescibacteria group bacterium]